MPQRSDAPLARHLTHLHGSTTALAWQRPPLVLLPGEGFVRHLLDHEGELQDVMPTVEHLPWDEVLFDFQQGRSVVTRHMVEAIPSSPTERQRAEQAFGGTDRGQCWIRVSTAERYAASVAHGCGGGWRLTSVIRRGRDCRPRVRGRLAAVCQGIRPGFLSPTGAGTVGQRASHPAWSGTLTHGCGDGWERPVRITASPVPRESPFS